MRRMLWAAILICMLGVAGGAARPAALAAMQASPMTDPRVDPNATLQEAVQFSQTTSPVAGPLQDTRELLPNSPQYLSSGVSLQDVYAAYAFTVPASDGWMMGFTFWDDGHGNSQDIAILSSSGSLAWALGHTVAGRWQAEQFEHVMNPESLGLTAGAQSTLALTVFDGVAIFTGGNSQIIGQVDIGGTSTGDVTVKMGWNPGSGNVASSMTASVSDVSVWDLSVLPSAALPAPMLPVPGAAPVLPPVQGASVLGMVFDQARTAATGNPPLVAGSYGFMVQTEGSYGFASIEANVVDFYTIITIDNPVDDATPFDFAIGFGADGGAQPAFILIIRSSGTWELKSDSGQTLTQGATTGLTPGPGMSNTIELLVQGGTGIVSIDGVVQTSFDVSSSTAPANIYLFENYLTADGADGQRLSYRDWWIYPISA